MQPYTLGTARRHLPRSYSRELPLLREGDSAGLPRVYAVAIEFIAHVDGRVDGAMLRAFLSAPSPLEVP